LEITVSPMQLHGIEVNEYAHELAQLTIWIGYIQWLVENGYGLPEEPILKSIQNIVHMDSILQVTVTSEVTVTSPREPEWPAADVIVGNPPFLGDKKMRAELGDKYVDDLRKLYEGRIPGQSDLVCYWFEKARAMIEAGKIKRAGLLATNSIRNGANNIVLSRIQETGNIFWALSDHEWTLDGAAVNVSMVGFDNGDDKEKNLDGLKVENINSDLSAHANIVQASKLTEDLEICFLGMMKAGPFDFDGNLASKMLSKINPNGKPNFDVVKPRMGGQDVTDRARDIWIIDFANMSMEEAAQYEEPFEYVKKNVKPLRDINRRERMKQKWWLFGENRPGLRKAIAKLKRCIVTPEVSKYRLFIWMNTSIIPDHKLHVIARDDDYFLGVLHSKPHEIWSLKMGSTLEDRPSYSSSRVFETFPFPFPPGKEPKKDPRVKAIAQAAKELVEQRDRWLSPQTSEVFETSEVSGKRTLTNLYNKRPTWLDLAHKKLDEAVFSAYGWESNLSDEEVLERLLKLNLERSKK
jgi:type II restriction/modification system DNA methylase subunit YeeA